MELASPSVGRIVFFGFVDRDGAVQERAAIVVRVFSPGSSSVNIQVFTDCSNDDGLLNDHERSLPPSDKGPGREAARTVWRTSVSPADDQSVPQAYRWRWPPMLPKASDRPKPTDATPPA
jgi:hypothetical protein